MGKRNAFYVAMVLCFASMVSAQMITGSGVHGYIPKFSETTTVVDSRIFQDPTGVGINTTTPAATLDVNGTINAATGFSLGGQPFAFGSYANQNAFLGFAGNPGSTAKANLAIGYQALYSDITGGANVAEGVRALYSNITGAGNIAIGSSALNSNTTGSDNTAIGYEALFDNTTGSNNTAHGAYALLANYAGKNATAVGYGALMSNPCQSTNNTGIGYFAGVTSESIVSCGQGNNNTFVGANTKETVLTFNKATAIGANAEVGESNALVLGSINGVNNATSDTKVGIGTTTPTNVFTIGQGFGHAIADGWDTYSSRRWKTNIETLPDALAKVEQLRGVSYDQKNSGKHEIGVIAEEVGAVVPEVVSWDKDGKEAQGVDYSRLTALLIEATKQQQALIHQQQEQIRKQQEQIQQQQQEVRAQWTHIDRLTQQLRHVQAVLKNGNQATASPHD